MTKSNSESNYYQYFDLTKDPFPIDSFDNVLFLTPELTSRLEEIKKYIIEPDKLILITSVPGAGKSTVSDYLESIPEKNWKVSLVQAIPNMDRELLSHEIIQQVSPDKADDKSFAIPQLHKFMELSSKTKQVPVFIIDDAHKLSEDTLEFILELSALKYAETAYRFVLFADENIIDKLNSKNLSELNEKLVTRISLPSLSKVQLKEYIDNRLSSSGEISNYPFTDEDIQNIFNISAGVPKGINILSRQIMESKRKSPSSSNLSPRIMATVGVLLIAGIVMYLTLFDNNGPQPDIQQPVIMDGPENVSISDTVSPVSSIQNTQIQGTNDTDNSVDEFQKINELAQSVSMNTIDTDEGDEGDEGDETDFGTSATEEDIEPVINSLLLTDQPTAIAEQAVSAVEDNNQSMDEINEIKEIALSETSVLAANDLPEEIFEPIASEPVLSVATSNLSEQLNIYKLDNIPDDIAGIKGETWYKEQKRTSYTLQLISASDMSNVLKLLEGLENFHEEMSGYIKYTPSGRPRYLLFFGLYPDKESAISAAASSVPDKIKSIDPYPRSLGGIVDEIDEFGSWPR